MWKNIFFCFNGYLCFVTLNYFCISAEFNNNMIKTWEKAFFFFKVTVSLYYRVNIVAIYFPIGGNYISGVWGDATVKEKGAEKNSK